MGYYTEHNLEVRKIRDKSQFEELETYLEEKDIINYALCQGHYNEETKEAYFTCYGEAKWYDHPQDMVAVAEKFPNMYFMLEGVGEEFGDFWREYYHDMDIEECRGEIIYEEPHKVQWKDLRPF